MSKKFENFAFSLWHPEDTKASNDFFFANSTRKLSTLRMLPEHFAHVQREKIVNAENKLSAILNYGIQTDFSRSVRIILRAQFLSVIDSKVQAIDLRRGCSPFKGTISGLSSPGRWIIKTPLSSSSQTFIFAFPTPAHLTILCGLLYSHKRLSLPIEVERTGWTRFRHPHQIGI